MLLNPPHCRRQDGCGKSKTPWESEFQEVSSLPACLNGRFRVEFQHQPPPFDVLCFYLTWISMVLISWSPFSSQSFPSTIDQPHFSKGVSLLLRNLLAFFTGRSNTCQEGSKLLSPVVVQFCPQVSGNYLDLSKDAWLVCNFCKALFF